MVRMHVIATLVFIVLGIVHTAMTLVLYDAINLDALWFAGTGLCLIFLGLFNLASRSAGNLILSLCIAANAICTVYFVLIVRLLPVTNAFFGLVLVLLMLTGTVVQRSQRVKMNF